MNQEKRLEGALVEKEVRIQEKDCVQENSLFIDFVQYQG